MTEGAGKIIYALVAKGVKPLSGYSNFKGTFDQLCINYLKNIGPDTSAAVKLESDYIIYYINENNITYLLMTDVIYPKDAAIGCLQSIKREFESMYPGRSFDSEQNFGLDEEFKVKLRMKFDYFNANQDVSDEKIGQLKDQMCKMKDEVLNASGLLNNRGEKLKVLEDSADRLSNASSNFYKQSKRVRRAELMKKIKLYGGITLAALIIIYIIIGITCGFAFQCARSS